MDLFLNVSPVTLAVGDILGHRKVISREVKVNPIGGWTVEIGLEGLVRKKKFRKGDRVSFTRGSE